MQAVSSQTETKRPYRMTDTLHERWGNSSTAHDHTRMAGCTLAGYREIVTNCQGPSLQTCALTFNSH